MESTDHVPTLLPVLDAHDNGGTAESLTARSRGAEWEQLWHVENNTFRQEICRVCQIDAVEPKGHSLLSGYLGWAS
jgi:hypothetical protein